MPPDLAMYLPVFEIKIGHSLEVETLFYIINGFPLEMYSKNLAWPYTEIGWKMVSGKLLQVDYNIFI